MFRAWYTWGPFSALELDEHNEMCVELDELKRLEHKKRRFLELSYSYLLAIYWGFILASAKRPDMASEAQYNMNSDKRSDKVKSIRQTYMVRGKRSAEVWLTKRYRRLCMVEDRQSFIGEVKTSPYYYIIAVVKFRWFLWTFAWRLYMSKGCLEAIFRLEKTRRFLADPNIRFLAFLK